MRDIAHRANVSQATVSFVLNNRKSEFISEETTARVLSTARELGYRPNNIARALAKGCTDTVGVWLKSLHSAYYMQLVYLLDQQITNSNYTMTFARNATIADTSSIMQQFPGMSVDGLIAVDIPETVAYFASHALGSTPIVNFGSDFTDLVDCVALDIGGAVRAALTHVYDRGRRGIAIIIDKGSHSVGGGSRLAEYNSFLSSAGLQCEVILIDHQSFDHSRKAVFARYSDASGNKPDALVCYNDDIAIGACRGLSDLGINVPGDVAVIGCDDIAHVKYLTPSLSTISHPHDQMCKVAWDFLFNRMKDRTRPIQYERFESQFIPREST